MSTVDRAFLMAELDYFKEHAKMVFANAEEWGFSYLTGERCGFMRRGLYDMNEHGALALRKYMGIPLTAEFDKPWNSTVDGKKSVGSVLLERAVFEDGVIPFAAMLKHGVCVTGEMYGHQVVMACGPLVFKRAVSMGVLTYSEIPEGELSVRIRIRTLWKPVDGVGPVVDGVCTHLMSGR